MRALPWLLAAVAVGAVIYASWPVDARARARAAAPEAARAFSEGRIRDCLDAFDPAFQDTSEGREIDREALRIALLGALGRRGGDVWTARIDDPGVELSGFDADAGTAFAAFRVQLLRSPPGSEYVDGATPVWEIDVEAELRRGGDGTWRFVRSSHRTLSGRAPYR